jgi:adenine deaminase
MSWRKSVIESALGKKPADLVITGGRLVNVNTREIYPADVACIDGRIAIVGDVGRSIGRKTEVVEAGGSYLVPGLIDSHMHTESSGVTLSELSRVLLPRGVTTILYAHEIANILGVRGMDVVRKESQHVPLKVYFQTPTSVPWAKGLETPGTNLKVADIRRMLSWEESASLGESDFFDVVNLDKATLAKLDAAEALRKPVDGHAAMLSAENLMAVAAGAFHDDHENWTAEEVLAKVRLGMRVMLREANIPWIAAAVTQNTIDTRNLLLCIDDKLINTLVREGGVDNTVRVAIQHGIDPMTAIQMATVNPATYFRLDLKLGSISPGRIGDILITESLETLSAKAVVANGQLVAREGKFLPALTPYPYPKWTRNSVHLEHAAVASDFEMLAGITEGDVEVRVLKLTNGGWTKEWAFGQFPVKGGKVVVAPDGSMNRIAVVERHGKDGKIGQGIVEGIGLKEGAIASSVAHDCHNITVVGTNPEDMAACVNILARSGGGFAAAKRGKAIAQVDFEIAGLISQAPYEKVVEQLDRFETAIRSELGFPGDMEFVVFNFIVLQSSPFQAAITDRGLIDVYSQKVVSLFERTIKS